MTYSNLVNYTFVSRLETFFPLHLIPPETENSGFQKLLKSTRLGKQPPNMFRNLKVFEALEKGEIDSNL